MHIATFLQQATARLMGAGIGTARLDCLILMEDVLGLDRSLILAHPERNIDDLPLLELNKKIAQRIRHVPLAYIRKKASFYGRSFIVDPHVLVPRPESEAIIDALKNNDLPPSPHIADVGTGSGCLGITAALEMNGAVVDLYDIDPKALAIARQNAAKYGAHVTLHKNDLLDAVRRRYDVVIANLPYVPEDYPINKAAAHEPALALYGGADGLDLYRRLWLQLALSTPSYVIIEALPLQHHSLQQLAQATGYHLLQTDGYIQTYRRDG